MVDIQAGLDEVTTKVDAAEDAVTHDGGSSPVLAAVVREFRAKTDKARATAAGSSDGRDAVIELEQAGDSAKAAAEADPGIANTTRQAVLDAHLSICMLKGAL